MTLYSYLLIPITHTPKQKKKGEKKKNKDLRMRAFFFLTFILEPTSEVQWSLLSKAAHFEPVPTTSTSSIIANHKNSSAVSVRTP